MIFKIRCTETYETVVMVKADSYDDALMRLSATQDDPQEDRLMSYWIGKGYQGRSFEKMEVKEEKSNAYYDFSAFD